MRNYSDEIEFISIVIPNYNRYWYLESLIESIHKYADIPFELIVGDDNSTDGSRQKLLEMAEKGKISSVVLNYGLNLGLSENINRCVRIAGSNYILMMNNDLRVETSFFKGLVNVLKNPFVGYISMMNGYGDIGKWIDKDGTKFWLSRYFGGGCILGFRKDNFEKIGGWDNYGSTSGNVDVSFMIRMIKSGLFPVLMLRNEKFVTNVSAEKCRGRDSTIGDGKVIHCNTSFPRLFGPGFNGDGGKLAYYSLSVDRCNRAEKIMLDEYRKDEGTVNLNWYTDFLKELIKEDYSIDWDEAGAKYGHDKWRDEIEKLAIIKNSKGES